MRRLAGRLVLALAGLSLLGVDRPPGLADVHEIRHWSYPNYTRVVVELSAPPGADAQVRQLPADPRTGRPARLYFDLPGVWVGRRFAEPIEIADGLLGRVRVGQNTRTRTRVVLDLERYEEHRLLRLHGPDRVVIDVFGERARGAAAPSGKRRFGLEARAVRHVIVDPGHGGRDPGAIGVGGLREKDVTLDVARRLVPLLRVRGFRVTPTRDEDRTLDLEERTAIAEGVGGDVFVSIHANAAPRRAAEGIEIYTLDERVRRQTMRVAARENGIQPAELNPLQRLLTRLRLSETSEHSVLLAELVHREIADGMGGRWPSTRKPLRKKGPFYVLYLASMPSVLLEVGFVTHREDARRLRDDAYLDGLAEEIADGLATYRDRLEPTVAGAAP